MKTLFKGLVTKKSQTDKDLMYMSSQLSVVQVQVHDWVYKLLGEVSSDLEGEGGELESYLLNVNPPISNPQGMARTKQTACKNKNQSSQTSTGGQQIAFRSPKRSPRLQEDSSQDSFHSVGSGMHSPWRPPQKRGAQCMGLTMDEGDSSDVSTRSKRGRVTGEIEDQPKLGGKSPRNPLPKKLPRKPHRLPAKSAPTKEMIREWNKSARIGFKSETAKGWLKKTERKRNAQGRVLRRLKPGASALREIQFYQRCQTFLIPIIPFQRLV